MKKYATLAGLLAAISIASASSWTPFLRGPSIPKSPSPQNPPALKTHVLTVSEYFLARFGHAQLAYEGAVTLAQLHGQPTNTRAIQQLQQGADESAILYSMSLREGDKPYTGEIEF